MGKSDFYKIFDCPKVIITDHAVQKRATARSQFFNFENFKGFYRSAEKNTGRT